MIFDLYYNLGFITFVNYSRLENTKLVLEVIDLISDLI